MKINYAGEKGEGLIVLISSMGGHIYEHSSVDENGENTHDWMLEESENSAEILALIDDYTLDEAKQYRVDKVAGIAKVKYDALMSLYSAAEMSSWPIMEHEAKVFRADGVLPDDSITVQEAAARGVAVIDLVTRIETNAANFKRLKALISGTDGKHRDAIRALTTFDDVSRYDINADWPAL